jgi:hypothetical protein
METQAGAFVEDSQFFGVVTSKKGKVFGLRLHTTVTVNQLIDEWLLVPPSMPGSQALDALVLEGRDLVLMG